MGAKMLKNFVYLIRAKGTDRYKIGITNDLTKRLSQLNGKQSAHELELEKAIKVPDARAIEKYLHCRYVANNVHKEWFRFSPFEIVEVLGELREIESHVPRVEGKKRNPPEYLKGFKGLVL
jgi:hypothetical protein